MGQFTSMGQRVKYMHEKERLQKEEKCLERFDFEG